MNLSTKELVILFSPLFFGMTAGRLSPMNKNSGIKNFSNSFLCPRPPSYIFGLVWPLLYLLFGLAWIFTIRQNSKSKTLMLDSDKLVMMSYIIYAAALLSLVMWTTVYNMYKSKKPAMFLLIVILMLTLGCYSISPMEAKLCLSPLIGWEIFALMLNFCINQ